MAVADYDFHLFDRVGDRLGRRFSDREARVLWHGLGGSRADTLRGMGVDPDELVGPT